MSIDDVKQRHVLISEENETLYLTRREIGSPALNLDSQVTTYHPSCLCVFVFFAVQAAEILFLFTRLISLANYKANVNVF